MLFVSCWIVCRENRYFTAPSSHNSLRLTIRVLRTKITIFPVKIKVSVLNSRGSLKKKKRTSSSTNEDLENSTPKKATTITVPKKPVDDSDTTTGKKAYKKRTDTTSSKNQKNRHHHKKEVHHQLTTNLRKAQITSSDPDLSGGGGGGGAYRYSINLSEVDEIQSNLLQLAIGVAQSDDMWPFWIKLWPESIVHLASEFPLPPPFHFSQCVWPGLSLNGQSH